MASPELVWDIVRNNSSFLVKRDRLQLTREPNNLTNKNSFKFSGLANKKSVGISTTDKQIVLTSTSKKSGNRRKPAKKNAVIRFKKGRTPWKRIYQTVAKNVSSSRPDLVKHALARASKLRKSMSVYKPKKSE